MQKQRKRVKELLQPSSMHIVKIPDYVHRYMMELEKKSQAGYPLKSEDWQIGTILQMSDGSVSRNLEQLQFQVHKNIEEKQRVQIPPFSMSTRELNPQLKISMYNEKESESKFKIVPHQVQTLSEMRYLDDIRTLPPPPVEQEKSMVKILDSPSTFQKKKFGNYVMKNPPDNIQPSRVDKRIRMKRSALEEKLFNYFEKKPLWNLRALRDQLDQPQAYLKEVLEEIADYHNKGANKGFYELKAEYKKN